MNNTDAKPTILIVDDIETNLQILGTILSENGYELMIAQSGLETIDILKDAKPDLILLDVMMPELDGYETAKLIKSNPKTSEIPIIFITAKAETNDIVKGFDVGAVDYITKPFQSCELLARVNTHLNLKFAKEKLIEMNNVRNKFFSIISHDLRGPFSGLIGLSELLAEDSDKMSVEEVKHTGTILNKSAKIVFELLENLLEWSRSQLGTMPFTLYILDPKEYVEKALILWENKAKEKNITLESIVDTKNFVYADNYMLNTILRNFIGNALKFTPIGGKIICGATDCEDPKFMKFYIKDNGIGIKQEDQDKLFRIDQKYVRQGTNNELGTGLGLILVKELVEKHNGKVWFESEEGVGTTFYFTLPIQNN